MKSFRVIADHPIFARPDRVVQEIELESYKKELELAGFENIKVTEIMKNESENDVRRN